MIDMPLNANVTCSDGCCGRSTYVLLDYSTKKLTHIIVRDNANSHIEHVVPISWIAETNSEMIRLDCTKEEFRSLEPFIEKKMVSKEINRVLPFQSMIWDRPYYEKEIKFVSTKIRHIPNGELAVYKGAHVRIKGKDIGRVIDFMVNSETDEITGIVVQGGRLWMKTDVTIPASQIKRLSEKIILIDQD
jgi:sporulation protein YlmC with PRC-barrel domain